MLGVGTCMGQEKKILKMTLENEMVPGGDGNYLVRACSAYVSCFGSLPSKTQLGGEQGGAGGDRGASSGKPSEMGESFRPGERQKGIKGGVWVFRDVKLLFYKGVFSSSETIPVTGKAEFVRASQGWLLG